MNQTNKTVGKWIAGLTATAALYLGALTFGSMPTDTKSNVLPFRGYQRTEDGTYALIFDKRDLENRKGEIPEVRAIGNPSGLEMGKFYEVEVAHPRWSWAAEPRVTSIKPADK